MINYNEKNSILGYLVHKLGPTLAVTCRKYPVLSCVLRQHQEDGVPSQ